jgi:hypothetical protein
MNANLKSHQIYIYYFMGAGAVLLSDTEQLVNWQDITPLQWGRILLTCCLAGFTAIKAYLDPSAVLTEPSKPPTP